jgi:hypothetical protein
LSRYQRLFQVFLNNVVAENKLPSLKSLSYGRVSYKMPISSNTNRKLRKKAFFAPNKIEAGKYLIIALTLLVGSFVGTCFISIIITAAVAQEANNNNNTTTGSTTTRNNATSTNARPSSVIGLLPQTVYQERSREVDELPMNQTHIQITFSGNGTVNLPNSTETIKTTSIGRGISSLIDGTFAGKVTLRTEDGSGNATATIYEIGHINIQDDTGKGIAIAVFHTNSTGKLAPLDGMILVGQDEFLPDGRAFITYWKLDSRIYHP